MASRRTQAQFHDAGRLALLDEVITAVSRAPEFARGIDEILAVTMGALDFEAGAVVLFDEGGQTAHLACERGMPAEVCRHLETFRVDQPPYDALMRGELLLHSRECGDRMLADLACMVTVPLGAGAGAFGALGLASRLSLIHI